MELGDNLQKLIDSYVRIQDKIFELQKQQQELFAELKDRTTRKQLRQLKKDILRS